VAGVVSVDDDDDDVINNEDDDAVLELPTDGFQAESLGIVLLPLPAALFTKEGCVCCDVGGGDDDTGDSDDTGDDGPTEGVA
jgi:hypothetical protein